MLFYTSVSQQFQEKHFNPAHFQILVKKTYEQLMKYTDEAPVHEVDKNLHYENF